MYSVFIVFISGHNIKLSSYEFAENAIADAQYHHQYARTNDCHFEVVRAGEVVFSTPE